MILPILIGSLFKLLNNDPSVPLLHKEKILAAKEISLANRYDDEFVNGVFKDNILLNIRYMEGSVDEISDIKWEEVVKPLTYSFTLNANETFAFQDDVLAEYEGKVVKTTNAHFNYQEGFKTDGYLYGDGVCHLASLIYWAAKDAGLETQAPTNHDFRAIPEIPKEYGVSIYSMPGQKTTNARQNLYITNNKSAPVSFNFEYKGNILKLTIKEDAEGIISYSL